MQAREVVAAIYNGILVGLFSGVGGLATGAISGSSGSAILTAAEYSGHHVGESTLMSSLGNGLLWTVCGFVMGAHNRPGFFGRRISTSNMCVLSITYSMMQTLGAILGYGLLKDNFTVGTTGTVTADTAVGSAVTLIPLAVAILCCLNFFACNVNSTPDEERALTY